MAGMPYFVTAAATGVLATIGLDLWAAFVKHVLRLPTANWAMVGRWIGHMRGGTFVHRHVADTGPVRHELAIGWLTHYAVGVVYGLAYGLIIRFLTDGRATLSSALIFALATLAAPWLVMQPAIGAGMFASRTPRPGVVRAVNVSMHLAFGLCLYGAWRVVG